MKYKALKAQKINKVYGQRKVVDDVNIVVNRGEVVGLLGPNGAGKTTTFYILTGMIKPVSGDVYLDDINITTMPMYKRAQLGVGYLTQDASVFTKLSVEDNIRLVLQMTDLNENEQNKKLEELLSEFSINHVRKNMAYALSGGERRRVEIARSLASNPYFVLLDEPFAGIDDSGAKAVENLLRSHLSNGGMVILTSHRPLSEDIRINQSIEIGS